MYKNVIENDVKLEGYCFIDEDDLEVKVSLPYKAFGSLAVDISTSDQDTNQEALTIYHKDIPKLIKVLEAAYTHKD